MTINPLTGKTVAAVFCSFLLLGCQLHGREAPEPAGSESEVAEAEASGGMPDNGSASPAPPNSEGGAADQQDQGDAAGAASSEEEEGGAADASGVAANGAAEDTSAAEDDAATETPALTPEQAVRALVPANCDIADGEAGQSQAALESLGAAVAAVEEGRQDFCEFLYYATGEGAPVQVLQFTPGNVRVLTVARTGDLDNDITISISEDDWIAMRVAREITNEELGTDAGEIARLEAYFPATQIAAIEAVPGSAEMAEAAELEREPQAGQGYLSLSGAQIAWTEGQPFPVQGQQFDLVSVRPDGPDEGETLGRIFRY